MIWEEALLRPVLGHGVGSSYSFVPKVWHDMAMVHNDYLRVVFELGFVGLAIYVAVLLWQMYETRIRAARSSGAPHEAFVAAFLGFCGLVITCCTDNTLIYNLWYTNPLFALLGAAYGAARTVDSSGNPITSRGERCESRC